MWARFSLLQWDGDGRTRWAKQRQRIWDHLSFRFASFICPSPQPFSLPASPISSDNSTGKGVEEEVGEGRARKDVGPLLLSHTSRVCASYPQDTLQWLPLAAHVWLRAKAPCSIPLLLTLSFFLPLCQSSSFHPLRAGEVHVRELRTSSFVRVAQLKGSVMCQCSAGTLTHTNSNLF